LSEDAFGLRCTGDDTHGDTGGDHEEEGFEEEDNAVGSPPGAMVMACVSEICYSHV